MKGLWACARVEKEVGQVLGHGRCGGELRRRISVVCLDIFWLATFGVEPRIRASMQPTLEYIIHEGHDEKHHR